MTNKELIDLIMFRVGNRKNPTLRAQAVTELQLKVQELELQPEVPWFLEKHWETSLVVGEEKMELPADFLLEIEETDMVLVAGGNQYLVKKRTLDGLRQASANVAPSIPKYYALLGNDIYFGPTPDEAYSIKVPYARKSVPFVENENAVEDWFKYALNPMVYSATAAIAADALQNDEMAQRYGKQASEAWQQFGLYCQARKYTNLTVVAGDE